jgi:predicted deacylase
MKQMITKILDHKIYTTLVVSFIFGLTAYIAVFATEKPVAFSYAGDTCVKQLTFLPNMHRPVSNSAYQVNFQDALRIGNMPVIAMKVCFAPQKSPKPGDTKVATAPFGSFFARKVFTISTESAPVANVSKLNKPVPVSKPLEIELSKPDKTFSYALTANSKQANCEYENSVLICDTPSLKLAQGKKYTLSINRSFKDSEQETIADASIKTLTAVSIKKSSIKKDQTIYAKPKTFTFLADKQLVSAEATILQTGKSKQLIDAKTSVNGKKVSVTVAKHLVREASYVLSLKKVEGEDGSNLVSPKNITFKTSGGPKVTSVNIGSSRVSGSAVATIQFDQELSAGADISKIVSISGGSATITKQSRSVVVALSSLPKCKKFTLLVKSGLKSKHDITSKVSWSFNSRTICHTVSTYGTSVQGRPLLAYNFGNSGPVTMYVGAIHGNEGSSSGLMNAWIEELEANPDKIGNRRIVVIPTINPDGLAANTRTNSRGVNLSRNFPTDNWVKDINDTDGKHKGGGGKKPLSEPEAKALASFTSSMQPRLLLSFHAIGSLVSGDPGGYSASYASKYASLAGYRDATGSSGTFDYDITGAYEDWSYRNAGIPSMVIELGSYGYYSIDSHRAALWAML